MSKKMGVSVIVLALAVIILSITVSTVAAQELISLSEETNDTTESMESLWDLSAGVATFVNPSVETSTTEETRVALENAAQLTQVSEEADDGDSVDIVMSDAGDTLDVMADPDETAEVVGYLYEDCGGKIIEQKDGWTLIRSGDLVGWAKDEDLAFDEQAYEMASEAGQSIVIVNAGALRARTEPSEDAGVATILSRGEELDFVEDLGEWVAADFNNEVVYLLSEYVTRDFTVDTGETVEAIEKREEAKRLEEERLQQEALEEEEAKKRLEEEKKIAEAQAAAQLEAEAAMQAAAAATIAQVTTDAQTEAQAQAVPAMTDEQIAQMIEAQAALDAAQRAAATQAAAAAATPEDVRLLGALIYCEAGNQSYEGKVAVGAVVMNRVKSGRYPNTIDGVIRASGQFTPVRGGKVDRIYAAGVPDDCMLAAQEALAGVSPVGDATHFRRNNGRPGQVLGAHVFY